MGMRTTLRDRVSPPRTGAVAAAVLAVGLLAAACAAPPTTAGAPSAAATSASTAASAVADTSPSLTPASTDSAVSDTPDPDDTATVTTPPATDTSVSAPPAEPAESTAQSATSEPGPTTTTCPDATATVSAAEPAGEPLVLVVGESTDGDGATRWTRPIDLAVYPGGAAVRPASPGDTGATVPALQWGTVDPCVLGLATTTLTELAGADFGQPTVSDQGTTTITLRPADGTEPRQIAVASLTAGSDSGLDDAQRINRTRLSRALSDLQAAVTGSQPWTPDRVRLIDLGGTPTDPALPWPGAGTIDADLQRSAPACTVLSGPAATAALDALGTGPSTATWSDGQRSVAFTATVLVPGQPGCPE